MSEHLKLIKENAYMKLLKNKMSLEEINKWLNNEYGVSYTKLEELHDFYFEKYCDLKQENKKLKAELQLYQGALKREHEAIHRVNELEKVIDEAIKLIEDSYYSKNTTDIDSIVLSSDNLIKVRRILKEVE